MGKVQLKILKRKKAVLFQSRVSRQNARSALARNDRAARQQLPMSLKCDLLLHSLVSLLYSIDMVKKKFIICCYYFQRDNEVWMVNREWQIALRKKI